MSVYQVTKLPCLSLPFGASVLPYQLLNYLEKFERVYLWMDFDEIGQLNLNNFLKKIGEKKCYPIKEKTEEELKSLTNLDSVPRIKDANDVLKFRPDLIWNYIKDS